MNFSHAAMRPRYLSLVLLAAAVAAPKTAAAQDTPADSVQHRNDCRLAEQILIHGQPAVKRTWALAILPTCEASGRIAVELLGRMATDPPEHVEQFIGAVSGLVHRDVALAAADLAAASGPTPQVRVNALRVLYAQAFPGFPISYSSITGVSAEPEAFVTDVGVTIAAELSAVDVEQIAIRAGALSRDTLAPAEVRAAAERVAAGFRALCICPRGTPPLQCLEAARASTP